MTRYKDAKIYKLVNDVDNKIYVGSTCMPLKERFRLHKVRAKSKDKTIPVYAHLNKIGWGNVKMVLIEAFPCKNKAELLKRERYYIEKLKPALNKRRI